MGAGADPAILGSLHPNQDAGDLLQTCLTMLGKTVPSSAPALSTVSSAQAASPAPIRFVVRSSNDSETISEHEKRERGASQADMMELERDASGMAKLRSWARDAASGDDARREEIATAVEGEPAGALRRLLYGGPE
eukprot:4043847-Prymnesium_polylepis.1